MDCGLSFLAEIFPSAISLCGRPAKLGAIVVASDVIVTRPLSLYSAPVYQLIASNTYGVIALGGCGDLVNIAMSVVLSCPSVVIVHCGESTGKICEKYSK